MAVTSTQSGSYQPFFSTFDDLPSARGRPESSPSGGTNNNNRSSLLSKSSLTHLSDEIDRLIGRQPFPPSNQPPIRVGWLKKEGEGVLGGHKKRWCIVSSKTLDFYKDVTDERPQGSIVLPGATIFPSAECVRTFHILPAAHAKTYPKHSFRCENEIDRNVWVKLLTDLSAINDETLERLFDAESYVDWSSQEINTLLLPALTRLLHKVGTMSSIWGVNERSLVGVLLSGSLTKMGDKVRSFKRRYFVLIGNIILYFDTQESYMMTDAGTADNRQVDHEHEEEEKAPELQKVKPVLGVDAPTAPQLDQKPSSSSSSTSSRPTRHYSTNKAGHGEAVVESLTRTHMRALRQSITPVDLQNHHIIRRASANPSSSSSSTSSSVAFDEKRMEELARRAMRGDGRSALGMIPLIDCHVNLEENGSHGGSHRPYGMSVRTKERKYWLFADSEAELRAWFYMINLVLHATPIRPYMKRVLEQENREDAERLTSPGIIPSSNAKNAAEPMHPDDLLLLKRHLVTTLTDSTCCRYFHHYWLERQSFHDPRTYPTLFPLDSPINLNAGTGSNNSSNNNTNNNSHHGRKYFEGLLNDEAGGDGCNHISIPVHYLHFWLDVEHWMNMSEPRKVEGDGQPNPYATPQDPSLVEHCLPIAPSYRQQRLEEIIDTYLSHGALYPVHLDSSTVDDIMSYSLRGPNAPNGIAPPSTLFQRAQEQVTELIAIDVFARYLRSKSSCWTYLSGLQAKYDHTLAMNRAHNLVPQLTACAYEPEVYEELTEEEKVEEELSKVSRFSNVHTMDSEELSEFMKSCAEAFDKLPQTDPTKTLYHNYLYAIQRLREYHRLFDEHAPTSPISIQYRRQQCARAIFHDFLVSGARYALCMPYKLARAIRLQLNPRHVLDTRDSGVTDRSASAAALQQFLFMPIEHVCLKELEHGLQQTKKKLRLLVHNQRPPIKKASVNNNRQTNQMDDAAAANMMRQRRASRITDVTQPQQKDAQVAPISESNDEAATSSASSSQRPPSSRSPPPPQPTPPLLSPSDTDVPFNLVFGCSSLFSHFHRFALSYRHHAPEYLWSQIRLVSRIFDLKRHLSTSQLHTAAARQLWSEYLSEGAPHKVSMPKSVTDALKVNVSNPSPGPHVFDQVLKELFQALEHLYKHHFRGNEAYANLYACLQADARAFIRSDLSLMLGRRDIPLDSDYKDLTSNNRNASTWIDVMDPAFKDHAYDESLSSLSTHQSMWLSYFKQFLTDRFCVENLSFYLESDDYRRSPGVGYRVLRAQRLYDRYISDTAELQVNVPSGVARELTSVLKPHLLQAIPLTARSRPVSAIYDQRSSAASNSSSSSASSTSPSDVPQLPSPSDPLLFIVAQREIFLLLLNDGMKPFLTSQHYKNYKKACGAKL